MDIDGKTALVTGGASGIGAAIAEALAKRGCTVVIADFDLPGAEERAARLGPAVSAVHVDAADTQSIAAMAEKVWQATGGVDLVFANAGVSAGAPLLNATPEQFDWQFAVNVRGVWATCREFANRMMFSHRPGHLVMTASEHSLGMQHTMMGFYTATKHAVLGMADVMRHELPANIGLSILCPGIVATNLHDQARFGVLEAPDDDSRALAAAVMRKGMPLEGYGEKVLAAVARGDFFIVTHPSSFAAAERRFHEIRDAFAAQAPATSPDIKYEVNAVAAEAIAELEQGGTA
ncbi:SDR family NAD(P)-dependent oxidoreductase [Pyruvatibacter mobilis]|uniref:SDR family NAD(P)-dependent oxidoreductase n=1 Tax=Pyruvatibacter mobilis TaxID=1712261 RepID=UPI003D13F7D6